MIDFDIRLCNSCKEIARGKDFLCPESWFQLDQIAKKQEKPALDRGMVVVTFEGDK